MDFLAKIAGDCVLVQQQNNRNISRDAISELVRDGSRQTPAQALKNEVETFVPRLYMQSRGMNAPKLAVADRAMGFWLALDCRYRLKLPICTD